MAINVRNNPDGVNTVVDGTFSPWEVVTDTNIQAEYGKAYILDGASPQTITLPVATPGSEGKGFAIKGQSSQLFTIAQNLSQSIDGIGWSTISGPTGGLQSLNRNCTIILISLFDSGLIFGTYGLGGYFDVIGQNITIYNDGIINFEDGELLIGSAADGFPQRGNIISSDGSLTITNQAGQIDITGAGGGGGSPIAGTLCDGGFYQDLNVANQTLAAVNTWEIVSQGVFSDAPLNNFDRTGVRLTYTGTETTDLDVSFTLTTDNLVANNNQFSIGIFKNGALVPEQNAINTYDNGTATNNLVMTVSRNITFSTGDYVEPFLRASNNLDFDFRELSFKAYGFSVESITPSSSSSINTGYIHDGQNQNYSVNAGVFIPHFYYSSEGLLFLSGQNGSNIGLYDVQNDTVNPNFISVTNLNSFQPGMHYRNDKVYITSSTGIRTDELDMIAKTNTEGVAPAAPGGYSSFHVFDPVTEKFYFPPRGSTDVLVFDPVALSWSTVASGLFPVGENSYLACYRSSKTGKIFFIPDNTSTGAIAIFDPILETVDLTTLNVGPGSNLYGNKPSENLSGNIYVPPRSSGIFLVIDPVNLTVDTTTYTGIGFCSSSAFLPSNRIIARNTLASPTYIIDFNNGGTLSSLSSYSFFGGACITETGKTITVPGSNNEQYSFFYDGVPVVPIEWTLSFMSNRR